MLVFDVCCLCLLSPAPRSPVPQSYLITGGMDGMVKAWQVLETPNPGMVIRMDPE
jgi:hypothetical protein